MSIYSKKIFVPKPPDKGSFPLDHDSECKHIMTRYLKCLNDNNNDSASCRDITKEYLQCRMDRSLMAKEEWNKLGLSDQLNK